MGRESRLGRALWIGLLVLLGGYVVADFARSPFLAPSGSAAVRGPELTVWVPAGELGGETEIVVRDAAAGLALAGHEVAVKALRSGSSRAVSDFLARPRGARGANLLAISGSTLADIARDRRDRLVPGASEGAALALERLRRAVPLATLASEPLALAVPAEAPVPSSAALLDTVRRQPWRQLFAIADDTWTRVRLAALVERAGVDGHVRFGVFHSGGEAAQAVESGLADTALATRSALRKGGLSGRLRQLGWPLQGGPAPRAWTALVAAPGLDAGQAGELRSWLRELTGERRWRHLQRRAGRRPGGPAGAPLRAMLEAEATAADRLELLAQRIERR